MPIIVAEKFESRSGDATRRTLAYVAVGTDDDVAARAAVLANAPATTADGLPRRDAQLDIKHIAPLVWDASLPYSQSDQQPQAGHEPEYDFDTTGGTQHIIIAKETVGKYGQAGDSAPDPKHMIGTHAGGVDGCDIVVPVFSFGETHWFFDESQSELLPEGTFVVDDDYKDAIYHLTGRTNMAPWRSFDAEEVLFLGARGSRRGAGPWEVRFAFAASPNLTNLTIGTITNIVKNGWDYLWTQSVPKVVGTAENAFLCMIPHHAYVSRVYDSDDFADLHVDPEI